LQQQLTSLQDEAKKAQSGLKEKLTAAAAALVAAKEMGSASTEKLTTVQNELNTTKAQLEQLTQDKAAAETKLQEELQAKEALEAKLKEEIQAKENAQAELEKAQHQTEETQAQLAALQKAKAELEKTLEGVKKEKATLEEKLKEAQSAVYETQKKMVLSSIMNTFQLAKIKFQTGSAILTKKSKALLDKVAKIIQEHPEYHYIVQGHTDSKGNEEFNLKLSQNRAKSVADYLISQGVDASLLSYEGYGSSQPIADNATPEGRMKNRRVVFKIVDEAK